LIASIRAAITCRKELILGVNGAVLFNLTAFIKRSFNKYCYCGNYDGEIIINNVLTAAQNRMTLKLYSQKVEVMPKDRVK
jgi:hypothetical protein